MKAKHALKTTKEALAATQETKHELALTRSVDESTPDARPREDPPHAATLPRGPLVAAALPRRPAAATAEVAPTEVATAGEGGTSRTAAEVMVVDVRRHELFLRGHAADAYNIPWSEMRERGFELPARGRRLAVLTEDDDAEVARARDWFATRSERCLWRVVSVARWRDGEGRGGPSRRGEFLFGVLLVITRFIRFKNLAGEVAACEHGWPPQYVKFIIIMIFISRQLQIKSANQMPPPSWPHRAEEAGPCATVWGCVAGGAGRRTAA